MLSRSRFLLLLPVLLPVLPMPASAQTVRGVVTVAGDDRHIGGAELSLVDASGVVRSSTLADRFGIFVIRAPHQGRFRLRAEHIAYLTVQTEPFELSAGEDLTVEIRMSETVVPLDPLLVQGRRFHDLGRLAGYYDRLNRLGPAGIGRFITRAQMDQRAYSTVGHLLEEVPSIAILRGTLVMQRAAGWCVPSVYLDGHPIGGGDLARTVPVYRLEGVEVYRVHAPAEYLDRSGCGVILAWTRSADQTNLPIVWQRLALTAGLLTFFTTLSSIFW
jgi:hypothetical protein